MSQKNDYSYSTSESELLPNKYDYSSEESQLHVKYGGIEHKLKIKHDDTESILNIERDVLEEKSNSGFILPQDLREIEKLAQEDKIPMDLLYESPPPHPKNAKDRSESKEESKEESKPGNLASKESKEDVEDEPVSYAVQRKVEVCYYVHLEASIHVMYFEPYRIVKFMVNISNNSKK